MSTVTVEIPIGNGIYRMTIPAKITTYEAAAIQALALLSIACTLAEQSK